MKRLTVPVYYDFASTLCYVAHRVMQRLSPELETLGIELAWRPVDLTRFSIWDRGARMGPTRRANVLRVSRELEVPFRLPDHWMDSRAAMGIAIALEKTDPARAASWRERVWSAVYDDGRDLDAPGENEDLAAELGVDLEAVDLSGLIATLEADTLECMEAEVSGLPTFMLDGYPIGGIHTDDTMRSLFGRYAERMRSGELPH